METVQKLTRGILDFALPPRCPSCGTITADSHSFCLECWKGLDLLGEPCCDCCGLPFAYGGRQGELCGACLRETPHYDHLRAAVAYGPVARHVALKLKYGGRPGVAETLARFMQRHVFETGEDVIIVPVPLHRWRIWRRGYNQAALLAQSLGRRTGRHVQLDLLERSRWTPSLRGLGRRARKRAVRGAFTVGKASRHRPAGKTILLIDDVYTTGATANACARVLKQAGAARVNILCWARVVATDDLNGAGANDGTR